MAHFSEKSELGRFLPSTMWFLEMVEWSSCPFLELCERFFSSRTVCWEILIRIYQQTSKDIHFLRILFWVFQILHGEMCKMSWSYTHGKAALRPSPACMTLAWRTESWNTLQKTSLFYVQMRRTYQRPWRRSHPGKEVRCRFPTRTWSVCLGVSRRSILRVWWCDDWTWSTRICRLHILRRR